MKILKGRANCSSMQKIGQTYFGKLSSFGPFQVESFVIGECLVCSWTADEAAFACFSRKFCLYINRGLIEAGKIRNLGCW